MRRTDVPIVVECARLRTLAFAAYFVDVPKVKIKGAVFLTGV